MAGRIECYTHSDNTTKNKAAAMVRLECQTDFAAKTPEFTAFAQRVAKYACGFQVTNPDHLLAEVPVLAEQLDALKAGLKEQITVAEIVVMTLPNPIIEDKPRSCSPTRKDYVELCPDHRKYDDMIPILAVL